MANVDFPVEDAVCQIKLEDFLESATSAQDVVENTLWRSEDVLNAFGLDLPLDLPHARGHRRYGLPQARDAACGPAGSRAWTKSRT